MSKRSSGVGVHAHGCTECGHRYEDVCAQPYVGPRGGRKMIPGPDGPCFSCRTGHPQPWWPEARLPRDCCREHSRLTRKEELERYRLAGSGPWYICTVCHRTFPFVNPAEEQEDERSTG